MQGDVVEPSWSEDPLPRYADQLAALGAEARLRIVRALLRAHPDGLVVSEITAAVGVSGSSLSHHLDRLKIERLVLVQRQGTFLRYRVNVAAVRELAAWFIGECCGDGAVLTPQDVIRAAATGSATNSGPAPDGGQPR